MQQYAAARGKAAPVVHGAGQAGQEWLVVIDEAYHQFAGTNSASLARGRPNVLFLRTFSKAWGLAALRLGMAFSSEPVIEILNKVKPPYNINQATICITLGI